MCVVRQRRAHARRVVFRPRADALPSQCPRLLYVHPATYCYDGYVIKSSSSVEQRRLISLADKMTTYRAGVTGWYPAVWARAYGALPLFILVVTFTEELLEINVRLKRRMLSLCGGKYAPSTTSSSSTSIADSSIGSPPSSLMKSAVPQIGTGRLILRCDTVSHPVFFFFFSCLFLVFFFSVFFLLFLLG